MYKMIYDAMLIGRWMYDEMIDVCMLIDRWMYDKMYDDMYVNE